MDRCRRAEALFHEKCAQLDEKEFKLEDCRLDLETFREETRVKQRAGQELTDELQARLLQAEESAKVARGKGKQLVRQERADELQAKLLQTEEELEVARGRAERVLKDHERIVQEHAEYEELIHRKGGSTISEVEKQTTELMEQYLALREECAPGSRELLGALEMVADRANMYKTVLARRPELRVLLANSSGGASASSSQARPQVVPRGRPQQVGPRRGGRAAGRGSNRVPGRGSAAGRVPSRGRGQGRLSVDDIMRVSQDSTSFEDRWLNFSRRGRSS